MKYTTADLLTNVKSKAAMPNSQTTFTDAQLLSLADEKIKSAIVPAVLATREDYYLTYIDYSTPSTSYAIPPQAIGMKIARVVTYDSTNTEWPCVRVNNPTDASESPDYFYILKNTIYFDSEPTKTVRIYYHVRPRRLAKVLESMQITGVSGAVLSVNAVPSNITSGDLVDIIGELPGYETLSSNNAVTNITGTDVTVTTAPSVSVGDWVSEAGYTAVPQIPFEMQSALEWLIAASVLKSQGDVQGAQMADGEAKQSIKDAMTLLQPRVDGASKKIVRRDSRLREDSIGYINQGIWIR